MFTQRLKTQLLERKQVCLVCIFRHLSRWQLSLKVAVCHYIRTAPLLLPNRERRNDFLSRPPHNCSEILGTE